MPQKKVSIGRLAQSAANKQAETLLAEKNEEIEALKAQLEAARSGNASMSGWTCVPMDRVHALSILTGPKLESIHQPRRYFDPQQLRDLAESIRQEGLKEPIVVRLVEDEYEILDGDRRWRAHQLIKASEIKAYIRYDVSDEEALAYALTTDALKEKISPLEQAIAVMNLLRLKLGETEGDIRKLLSQMQNDAAGNVKNSDIRDDEYYEKAQMVHGVLNSIGIPLGTMVNNRLKYLDLSPAIRRALEEEQISPTNALKINKVDPKYHLALIEQGAGLSGTALADLIKRLTAGGSAPSVMESFPNSPADIYQESMSGLKTVAKSPIVEVDKRARKMLLKIYQDIKNLEQYTAAKQKKEEGKRKHSKNPGPQKKEGSRSRSVRTSEGQEVVRLERPLDS
jgi:ParB family chromosome partitioning protein